MPQKTIDDSLLHVIACPLTKTELIYDEDAQELISHQAGLAFPVRDGLPILLIGEARKLED